MFTKIKSSLILIIIIIREPLDNNWEQTLESKDGLITTEVPQKFFCSLVFVVFNPLKESIFLSRGI